MNKEVYTVYGFDDCPGCNKSKKLLEKHNKTFNYVNVVENLDVQKAFFKKTTGTETPKPLPRVPQIYWYDPIRSNGDPNFEVHIGGLEDLEAWLTDNYRIKGQHPWTPSPNEWKGLI